MPIPGISLIRQFTTTVFTGPSTRDTNSMSIGIYRTKVDNARNAAGGLQWGRWTATYIQRQTQRRQRNSHHSARIRNSLSSSTNQIQLLKTHVYVPIHRRETLAARCAISFALQLPRSYQRIVHFPPAVLLVAILNAYSFLAS